MMNNRIVNTISARLSLRPPQRESLEILADIDDHVGFTKDTDPSEALSIIRAAYPNVSDFERDFPSLCFALATGVGKTRLMGAFIAYLNQAKGIRHFFVLAPNLTIYNKLIADFTPNTPKYVFQGIEAFAIEPPEIITGDNYESGRGVRAHDLFGETAVHINIFNISKINSEVRGGKAPRIKRLSEYIGESYFNYLAGLSDLVLIMDESHRYRGSAGINAINELKPILGLELTATPQVEAGTRTIPFNNVIYSYPLAMALNDGFVKEPTVATRENFIPSNYSPEELETIKLKDGVLIHESTKVDLETFARQNDRAVVKPFMLIVARDTDHAGQLLRRIKSDDFFDGNYKEKVITVHSNQRGEEADETVKSLLAVEDPKEPTEIVIHVNMLKEGWDVTNLYTIVPLRAANSRTLVEQSIGRGLRLPYGKRVGVNAVDRLTIVAHDKFQEIVDEANRPDSVLKVIPVYIGKDIAVERKTAVTVEPSIMNSLFGGDNEQTGVAASDVSQPKFVFEDPIHREIARTTYDVIKQYERLGSSAELRTPKIQEEIVRKVRGTLPLPVQASFAEIVEQPNFEEIVEKVTEKFVEMTIDIPRIVVEPKGDSPWTYKEFQLDTTNLNLQPVSDAILLQSLQNNRQERLVDLRGLQTESVLENYIVKSLIDFDDISYDDHADLLYDLSRQVLAHVRSYQSEEKNVINILQYHSRRIAESIHAQMLEHQIQNITHYEVKVTKGFITLRNSNYSIDAAETTRNFRAPVDNPQQIKSMHFGGFEKCLYPIQQFHSDSERRFSIILENDSEVIKWFKPSRNQFQIFYNQDERYEPDFVVETHSAKFLIEIKRAGEMEDATVKEKEKAAKKWCEHASVHENSVGGKSWQYCLIPHNAVLLNSTFAGIRENA
ncbi:MAG: DEAD/DEAH box helicase family protein [Pyrinomonadaceae bacterium]|nr:DEAD/DEAH box helicase family protein [Pyrinomonadaceae bacterium]